MRIEKASREVIAVLTSQAIPKHSLTNATGLKLSNFKEQLLEFIFQKPQKIVQEAGQAVSIRKVLLFQAVPSGLLI